jgi:predicted DNA-binding protein
MEKEQTTIRLPEELKERLQSEADRKGYTLKDLIVFILHKHF